MSNASLPDGWRNTFEGSRILEFSYRSDNIEVNVTPDTTPEKSRNQTASDTQYRVELKRNDAGTGGGWELDTGWGDDAEEFELVRAESMRAAREQAIEFMDRFNQNRQAVEEEDLGDIQTGEGGEEPATQGVDGDDHSGAVFDHDAAAAAVVRDAAAAVRAAEEMSDSDDASGFRTPEQDRSSPDQSDRAPAGEESVEQDEGDVAEDVGSLVDILRDELGDALRIVLHYERGEFETAYHDDPVVPVEAYRDLHGELQFLDAGILEGELPDAGSLSFTMTTFAEVRVLRVVRGDTRETLVGLDRDAEVAFPELYDRIEAALDGES